MTDSLVVFARMLARAYRYEDAEQEIISQALLETTNANFWDVMFQLMKDNEIHKRILEQMVEDIRVSLEDFREYSARNIKIPVFDFSGNLLAGVLNELLKYEHWTKNYYRHMLDLADPMLSKEIDRESVEMVQKTLKELTEWEQMHIRKINDLLEDI